MVGQRDFSPGGDWSLNEARVGAGSLTWRMCFPNFSSQGTFCIPQSTAKDFALWSRL